jgi:hypothetical protein
MLVGLATTLRVVPLDPPYLALDPPYLCSLRVLRVSVVFFLPVVFFLRPPAAGTR